AGSRPKPARGCAGWRTASPPSAARSASRAHPGGEPASSRTYRAMRADPPGGPGPADVRRRERGRAAGGLAEPVTVARPIRAAGPAERPRHLRRGGAGGPPDGTRAVLAEDSALFREGLTRLLTDAGYDVVAAAADAGELLRQVRGHRPDVVITDIRMPPTHTNEGLVAALQIRSEFPHVAVMVLSQYVETTYAVKLLG